MGFKIKAQTQKKDDCGLQPFPSSEFRLTPSEMNRSLVAVARRVLSLHSTPSSSHCRFYCSSSSSPSNNKLFVGGLSWSVNEKTLKDAFDSYGDVTEVRILYDKETGRSRGFGFVYFSKEDEAISAKDAMDGKAFLGRPLRISFALDKVRGAPVVVPRLSNLVDAANRNK